jgi:hypothetical protein
MCDVLLPPGVNPIAVKYVDYIHHISKSDLLKCYMKSDVRSADVLQNLYPNYKFRSDTLVMYIKTLYYILDDRATRGLNM